MSVLCVPMGAAHFKQVFSQLEERADFVSRELRHGKPERLPLTPLCMPPEFSSSREASYKLEAPLKWSVLEDVAPKPTTGNAESIAAWVITVGCSGLLGIIDVPRIEFDAEDVETHDEDEVSQFMLLESANRLL